MNKLHHAPQAAAHQVAVITVSGRKAWSVAEVIENGHQLVELRALSRHADGSLSPSNHRSTFRRDAVPHLIEALQRISKGAAAR